MKDDLKSRLAKFVEVLEIVDRKRIETNDPDFGAGVVDFVLTWNETSLEALETA